MPSRGETSILFWRRSARHSGLNDGEKPSGAIPEPSTRIGRLQVGLGWIDAVVGCTAQSQCLKKRDRTFQSGLFGKIAPAMVPAAAADRMSGLQNSPAP